MDAHFGHLGRLSQFFAFLFPHFKFEKRDFNKENADQLLLLCIDVLDGLFKAENLAQKKNFQLPGGRSFFSRDVFLLLENSIAYLQVFNTQILAMSKTERQTLAFILENIGDYFKNEKLQTDEKLKKNVFNDYKFWIENFFKLLDKKIGGAVTVSQNSADSMYFIAGGASVVELIYTNAALSFNLAPFFVFAQDRVFFLARIGAEGLVYRNWTDSAEMALPSEPLLQKVHEFFLANFCFAELDILSPLVAQAEKGWQGDWRQIETAFGKQQLKLFAESQRILEEASFEGFNMPLVYLLQIRNLAGLNRGLDMKRLLQKFLLFYSSYAEAHELMGDIYWQEENVDLALSSMRKR